MCSSDVLVGVSIVCCSSIDVEEFIIGTLGKMQDADGATISGIEMAYSLLLILPF